MCVFCDSDPKLSAKFFGYQRCCVKWYKKHGDKYGHGTDKAIDNLTQDQIDFWEMNDGIGFIPCPNHAKKVVNGEMKVEDLVKDRIFTLPFPQVHEHDSPSTDQASKEFEIWKESQI